MNEKERIELWLTLYETGDIMDSECYIGYLQLIRLLKRFGVMRSTEVDKEILILLAWGVIEELGPDERDGYRRNKNWKPSLGMLFLDRMEERQPIGGEMIEKTKTMEATIDSRKGKEIKDLISVLEQAIKKRYGTKYSLQAEVCIDCKKVISIDYEPVNGLSYSTHRNHLTIESDVDRNEIGDWLNALKWVLDKNKEEKRKNGEQETKTMLVL